MDSKDFKISNMGLKKRLEFKTLIKKMFNERTSRPRADKNIINPKQKGI